MKTLLPAHTLTWGTASAAVASALVLACIGCLVPVAQRTAATAQAPRAGSTAAQLGRTASRQVDRAATASR